MLLSVCRVSRAACSSTRPVSRSSASPLAASPRSPGRAHLQLDVPTVAADGRVVPVMIESDLPMAPDRYVKAVHVLVDNNPDIHLAEFRLTPQIGQAFVSTRIKMRMTSPVRAVVETSDGALWGAAADVRVTVNGCG
ncbi:MAG: thiosulfate oxidation carrier protein SoxY [Gemmatimonadetes bacterium]|nr:MAG: thiosulfate oxidation carrier protein SoxY [Gemmatimonadota bacterium]